jgi:Fe-Mn family superoxide dismutase
MTTYSPKKFEEALLGMAGFSDSLLLNHFTLYEGYVNNVNKLSLALSEMAKEGKFGTLEYNELKRRFGWEYNGMRLHEWYFENMNKNQTRISENSLFQKTIEEQYGSFSTWLSDFKGVGAMRGIGWSILYKDLSDGKLMNVWINEHDLGHLAGCSPMLVLDVFEHAYIADFGIKRNDYIEAFIRAVDWNVVEKRFATSCICQCS